MKTIHFPITVVDDFFEYPDEVREFALQQEYFLDVENRWPGKRTKPLHEINFSLFNSTVNKVIYLFYNSNKTKISCLVGRARTILDPLETLINPAELVGVGVHWPGLS